MGNDDDDEDDDIPNRFNKSQLKVRMFVDSFFDFDFLHCYAMSS